VVAYTSVAAGLWHDSASWSPSGIPVDTDTITNILHAIRAEADVTVGVGTGVAVNIGDNGTLTFAADTTNLIKGGFAASGDIMQEAGSSVAIDTTDDVLVEVMIGTTHAAWKARGTKENPCTLEYIGTGSLRVRGQSSPAGSGRMDCEHLTIRRLDNETTYPSLGYNQDGSDVDYHYRLVDCTLDNVHQFASLTGITIDTAPSTGVVEVTRCKWINCVVPGGATANWANIKPESKPGMSVTFDQCDFDATVHYSNSWDVVTRGCVFRKGYVLRDSIDNAWTRGFRGEFSGNFVYKDSSTALLIHYGDTIRGNVLIDDSGSGNPHFFYPFGGTGVLDFSGNVLYSTYDGVGISEGDGVSPRGPASGTQAANRIDIIGNWVIPNRNGPGGDSSHTATLSTLVFDLTDSSFRIVGNFAYNGSSMGASNANESELPAPGSIEMFRSNIVHGRASADGMKLKDLGFGAPADDFMAETHADTEEVANWNVGYLLAPGDESPGGGYENYPRSGAGPWAVGTNDTDDVDPMCHDLSRNPETWAVTLTAAMDRIGSGTHTTADLIAYIADGCAVTNPALIGVGQNGQDPGPPGAVVPSIGTAPVEYEMALSLFQGGVAPVSWDEFIARVNANVDMTHQIIMPGVIERLGVVTLYLDGEPDIGEIDAIGTEAFAGPP